jgi:antitoxin PrlF
MITSKLTSKGRTTVPQAIRTALKLVNGDELIYEISGDRVVITKSRDLIGFDPFALFDEWNSDADRRAYADL